MLGLELVVDKKNLEVNSAACAEIFERTKELGLLLGKGGASGNVLRIKPVMCIHKEDVHFALQVLDYCIGEYSNKI